MNLHLLVRMARVARNPPRGRRAWVMGGAVVLALALWGVEQVWGWPEALTPERADRRPAILR